MAHIVSNLFLNVLFPTVSLGRKNVFGKLIEKKWIFRFKFREWVISNSILWCWFQVVAFVVSISSYHFTHSKVNLSVEHSNSSWWYLEFIDVSWSTIAFPICSVILLVFSSPPWNMVIKTSRQKSKQIKLITFRNYQPGTSCKAEGLRRNNRRIGERNMLSSVLCLKSNCFPSAIHFIKTSIKKIIWRWTKNTKQNKAIKFVCADTLKTQLIKEVWLIACLLQRLSGHKLINFPQIIPREFHFIRTNVCIESALSIELTTDVEIKSKSLARKWLIEWIVSCDSVIIS